MRVVLAAFLLVLIATDVIRADPSLARGRCRGIGHQRLERFRPVAARCVRTPDNESELSATTPSTRSLFNGHDLVGWSVINKYDFARHGNITVEDDAIILGAGTPATGIRIDGDFPRMNYEVILDAKRIEGSDFFCGITFPVGEDYLSLVLGGWGGEGRRESRISTTCRRLRMQPRDFRSLSKTAGIGSGFVLPTRG